MTRVAVVDIGTNSTRLLVAEPDDGTLRELARESIVTRLGEGVDRSGRLADEAQRRVLEVLERFRERIGDVQARAMPSFSKKQKATYGRLAIVWRYRNDLNTHCS